MDSYLDSGLAASTIRTYDAGIKHYSTFCEQLNTQITLATEPLLCRFVTYLANINIAHNSIKVYLAGVRQLHIRRGVRMPATVDMPRLNQVLRGIKICQSKAGGTTRQPRLPVTPDTLQKIKIAWEQEGLDKDKIMLWAAFTTCFFGFMRSGEISLGNDSPFDPTRDLTPQDIEVDSVQDPRLVRLHLKHSKTDPFGEGSDIFVARTYNELCPVSALLAWLTHREADRSSPLFYFQSGVPLTRSTFVTRFKEALSAAGINPARFSGHSFRIGAATTAAQKGMADSAIKLLGRWKSSAYQRYVRPSPDTVGSLASSISTLQQPRHQPGDLSLPLRRQ